MKTSEIKLLLKDQQIEEWFESQATIYFFRLIQDLRDNVDDALRDQGYDTDSADRLMAQRANLCGLYSAFDTLLDAFESQSFEEMEEEDGEPEWDISPG
ncbi:MAG: hypothetical protein HKN13_12670 [Rhodothermales bacterium]|nr:hypothetical protein [Rhodothermales bacterium]